MNHTGLLGGGERSLLGLLEALPATVNPRLACPHGQLRQRADDCGVPVSAIAASTGSLRLHPVNTPSALGAMANASAGLLRIANSSRADLLHANSIRAGMIAAPVAQTLRLPLVLHVRDSLPSSPITRTLQSALATRATAVIAISRYVAERFDPSHRAHRLEIIDNPFNLARLDPSLMAPETARARLGIPPDIPILALIGQITPWKGQEEAVRALGRVRQRHRSARLLIVGEPKFVARATRHDNLSYLRRLHELIGELRLGDAVRFLGEREDVPGILRACDVVLLPSWEEPFGRVVVEAMAMSLPVVATAVGGPSEVIRDGIDGTLVPPRKWDELAAAIERLLDDPSRGKEMGTAARAAVLARFGHNRHAAAVSALYNDVIGSCTSSVPRSWLRSRFAA